MKSFLKENWFKLSIVLVLVPVVYAVYFSLVVAPQKRALQEENIKKERKDSISSCITEAETAYSDSWYHECKSSGILSNKCIDIQELSFKEYLTKYHLSEEEYKQQRGITDTGVFAALFEYLGRGDNECSCRLPLANADRLNTVLQNSKDACYKLYPQN